LILIYGAAITRAFTLIYTLALLTLLTRIQLNLLGRRSYLSSVVSLATGGLESSTISLENHDDDNSDQAYGNDFETNRRYLTFSWWLLHRGWKAVMVKVETAVKEVFGTLSPRDDVSMQTFSELTLEVRKKVEGATEAERGASRWLEYLLPPRELEDFVLRESGMTTEPSTTGPVSISSSGITPLRRLLDETSDLIDSPPFTHVLTLLLDAGYSTLVDSKLASQAYKVPLTSPSPDVPQITEIHDPKPVKLPIVLAILTRQAHCIGNGVPNEYLQAMEQVRDLEAFAAVVYSSNWENEILPLEDEGGASFVNVEGTAGSEGVEVKEDGDGDKAVGEESVVDVGAKGAFESAWGKAVGK
jgi:peroxin-3